jgi:hypothetical protein
VELEGRLRRRRADRRAAEVVGRGAADERGDRRGNVGARDDAVPARRIGRQRERRCVATVHRVGDRAGTPGRCDDRPHGVSLGGVVGRRRRHRDEDEHAIRTRGDEPRPEVGGDGLDAGPVGGSVRRAHRPGVDRGQRRDRHRRGRRSPGIDEQRRAPERRDAAHRRDADQVVERGPRRLDDVRSATSGALLRRRGDGERDERGDGEERAATRAGHDVVSDGSRSRRTSAPSAISLSSNDW